MVKKSLGSVKRFGARYGRTVKHKFGQIEIEQRKSYQCPSCRNMTLKRLALGIWQCKKCGAKLAGKAYSVSKKRVIREEEIAPAEDLETMAEESEEEVSEEEGQE